MQSSKFVVGAKSAASALALCALVLAAGQAQAATIVINNQNAAGVGFNDPTPATPVGGNPGTTLGEQRLFAFTYAANLWGAALESSQPIVINARMTSLACTATSATLGSAGSTSTFRNFANAPKADTWYSYALANKLSGTYLGTLNAGQITANFNSDLGMNANCLPGRTWYLGLDHNHGTDIDFVVVLLHEMGHGLGFQTFTNGSTGNFSSGFPSIWDHYMLGLDTGKLWKDMTATERRLSAISRDGLVWTGERVTASLPSVLTFGLPTVTFSGPSAGAFAGAKRVGEADFGPALSNAAVYGEVMPVVEQTVGAGESCEPYNTVNARAVQGKIALINLGVCTAAIKTKNAQNAGAIGVLISDNAADGGVQPIPLGGWDRTLTIPAVRMFMTDGNNLREALKRRSRTGSGVFASMGRTGSQYAGADPLGRAILFVPNPFVSGSSVSHFDRTAFRNLLMEPAISNDLGASLIAPNDLTLDLLKDIGW